MSALHFMLADSAPELINLDIAAVPTFEEVHMIPMRKNREKSKGHIKIPHPVKEVDTLIKACTKKNLTGFTSDKKSNSKSMATSYEDETASYLISPSMRKLRKKKLISSGANEVVGHIEDFTRGMQNNPIIPLRLQDV